MMLAVLQARCSSERLPGKVLMPILGVPMILRQIERIRRSRRVDEIVVVTSTDPSDDVLAQLLEENSIGVRRGALDDVLSRFLDVAREFRPESIVRLTGDNPLTDAGVIDTVIEAHVAGGSDYTSNSLHRTYPYGLDLECVRTDALLRLGHHDLTPAEREHVTLGIYSRPDSFTLTNIVQDIDESAMRWSVDYPEDMEFVRAVFAKLYPTNPNFTKFDVVEVVRNHPELDTRESSPEA